MCFLIKQSPQWPLPNIWNNLKVLRPLTSMFIISFFLTMTKKESLKINNVYVPNPVMSVPFYLEIDIIDRLTKNEDWGPVCHLHLDCLHCHLWEPQGPSSRSPSCGEAGLRCSIGVGPKPLVLWELRSGDWKSTGREGDAGIARKRQNWDMGVKFPKYSTEAKPWVPKDSASQTLYGKDRVPPNPNSSDTNTFL